MEQEKNKKSMTLAEFAKACHSTNDYSDDAVKANALFLGLAGEAGEAAEQAKKCMRDDNCRWTPERAKAAAMEVFDVMWYATQVIWSLGYSIDDVAQMGLDKLARRKADGKIHGEGSNR